ERRGVAALINRGPVVVARLRIVVPTTRGLRSAVDVDRVAGDTARHLRRKEKHCRPCHLVDMTGPAHRNQVAGVLRRPSGEMRSSPSAMVRSGASTFSRMFCGGNSRAAVLV